MEWPAGRGGARHRSALIFFPPARQICLFNIHRPGPAVDLMWMALARRAAARAARAGVFFEGGSQRSRHSCSVSRHMNPAVLLLSALPPHVIPEVGRRMYAIKTPESWCGVGVIRTRDRGGVTEHQPDRMSLFLMTRSLAHHRALCGAGPQQTWQRRHNFQNNFFKKILLFF